MHEDLKEIKVTSDYLWLMGYSIFYFFFKSVYIYQILFNEYILF